MQDFEKLGAFYLGKVVDPATNQMGEELLLYDSRDLTTHAVIIGMTGSGKTGLGLGLIEEAAMDGIPVIAIDPKGDIANLLLGFPDLQPADFRPWVGDDEAAREGITADELAAKKAETWRTGLADWGQDGERIRAMQAKVDFAIYTPGGSAGLPVSVLKGFDAPPPEIVDDAEGFQERISGTVTGLLGLLKIDADPLRSREHVLLSTILANAWGQGRSLDLGGLIAGIQQPAFDRVGVMDLESFYPAKERFELAMSLNNLLASPGFQAWTKGEPLDVKNFLYTASGKPRVSIFSIAHLDDAERMFFVSMLLNATLGWVRQQPGTSSLRALLYMDEIFGYFPPNGNPPSKTPMLTLLKQARAFGLGLVLSTQNPVDLDYKGLSNTGTWFIGRLQTENDKARVLEALQGAMAGSDALSQGDLDKMLSGLGKRVFLMHNVHEGHPVLFQTRWTMSYLAGPVTGTQIRTLMAGRKAASGQPPAANGVSAPAPSTSSGSGARPVVPPGVKQYFLPVSGSGEISYHPQVLGAADVRYASAKHGLDTSAELRLLAEIGDGALPVDWDNATEAALDLNALEAAPVDGATFAELPGAGANAKNYDKWGKDFAKHVQNARALTLLSSPGTKLVSQPGETEADFRVRADLASREARDAAVEKLRAKYAPKVATLEDRMRRAEARAAQQQVQARQAQLETAMSVGASVLGALFGGGRRSGVGSIARGAGTAVRSAGRAYREHQDIGAAADSVEAVQGQLADLQAQAEAEMNSLIAASAGETLVPVPVRPKSTDINVQLVALAWCPFVRDASGRLQPAWG